MMIGKLIALLLCHLVLSVHSQDVEERKADYPKAETTVHSVSSKTVSEWPPAASDTALVSDLHSQYYDIFHPHNNRNAAAHLWSSFLLDRSTQMTPERMRLFMSGYCVVSGSPIGRPNAYNRYRLTLPLVAGATEHVSVIRSHESSTSSEFQLHANQNTTSTTSFVTGFLHYCCWPCVCDTQDFLHVDTKTIHYRGEIQRQEYFVVMGNPCQHPGKLKEPFHQPFYNGRHTTLEEVAPAVHCLPDGTLQGATLSDHGYVILGMFLHAANSQLPLPDLPQVHPGRISSAHVPVQQEPSLADTTVVAPDIDEVRWERVDFHDEREWGPTCLDRAKHGYNSGMGEIFRQVCAIAPIDGSKSAIQEKRADTKKQ